MIYIFWPGKAVPEWLVRIDRCDGRQSTPTHFGWGIACKYAGAYQVFLLAGGFVKIHAVDCSFEVKYGERGIQVNVVPSSFSFCALSFLFGFFVFPYIIRWLT